MKVVINLFKIAAKKHKRHKISLSFLRFLRLFAAIQSFQMVFQLNL